MKTLSKYFYTLLLLLCSAATPLLAQKVGSEVFMQGTYVEVGVSECGSYGTVAAPPIGYHENSVLPGLGYVADQDKNGWTVGVIGYCGDFFVPGSPVEGWSFRVNGIDTRNSNNGSMCQWVPDTTFLMNSHTYHPGVMFDTSIWVGSYAGIQITQMTILPDTQMYFFTKVQIRNTTPDTLKDVYYGRNVDPDNEQPWSGSFITIQEILSQPIPPLTQAIVSATGTTYGCFMALGSEDTRARANYGKFYTEDAHDYYLGTSPLVQTVGSTSTADEAISLGFSLGDLLPGDSTGISPRPEKGSAVSWVDLAAAPAGSVIELAYVHVFELASMDAGLAHTNPQTATAVTPEYSLKDDVSFYPQPAIGDLTIEASAYAKGSTTVDIYDIRGGLVTQQIVRPGQQVTINTNEWEAGIYLYRLSNTRGNNSSGKLIVQ